MAFKTKKINVDNDLRKTGFYFTINSNKVHGQEQFEEVVEDMLDNIDNYLEVYKKEDKKFKHKYKFKSGLISDENSQYYPERGGKFSRIHAHALISFSHDDKYRFRIDINRLRADYAPKGDPSNLINYINVRYTKDDDYDIRHYIAKTRGK